MPSNDRPLRSLQRNWLLHLRANPGQHYVELTKRELVVLESLQRRGLVHVTDCGMSTAKGRTVYIIQAITQEPQL